jgi:hypothetical protein
MADTQLQLRTAELFENPNVALVVVANAKDRSIIFKTFAPSLLQAPAGPPGVPSQDIVDAYVSAAAAAAASFDADSDDGWIVARFRSRSWDVIAYRSVSEGPTAAVSNLVMVSFVRP